jgi:histidinol dehydrogenase
VKSRLVWRPIGAAGLYVPGGSAPLFSSLLMLAIPAAVAGVRERVAVTPPSKDGGVHPAMILAASEAGLDALWLIGGAQAIAALTFGVVLEDGVIPACDKLFGPGNAYVAEAKR